ncbi:MAG: hypothetical protein ACOX81_05855 [Candidatus Heteroscillospira sp.]|jgi:hypothetical protein
MELSTKIQRHNVYWNGEKQEAPLITMRYGNVFHNRMFRANDHLLKKGLEITPDMIHVEDYLADYERLFGEYDQIEQDGIYACEPICGFPWIEAILGCKVLGTESSFVTEKVFDGIENVKLPENIEDSPWYKIYFDFHRMINEAGKGRFTSGQPIMRGVTDTLGALMGQSEMLYAMFEEPEEVARLYDEINVSIRKMADDIYKYVQPVGGGYVMGFYNIWTPEKNMWYQEDLSALFSPPYFEEFLKKTSEDVIRGYKYNMVHLHPASFHLLDDMLQVEGLMSFQVNKDNNGPSVRDMIPQFKKILEADKRILIKGSLNFEDADAIIENLPPRGVAIQSFNPTVEGANQFCEYVREKAAKL